MGRIGPRLSVALLSLLLTTGGVGAQSTTVLTLDEALGRARDFNPDYRMAQNDLELSRTGRREALGAFLPDLNLSASTGLSFDRQRISTDFFGNPIENPVTEWQTSSSASQYLGGSITLFQGGQRFHQLSVESADAVVREATAATQLRTIRGQVVRVYYQAQAQQARLGVEEGLLDARRLDLEMTQRMYELAGATRVEVLAAELNVQRQEQRIQQTLAGLEQGLLSLRTAIGDPSLESIGLSDLAPVPFDPALLDLEALVERALLTSPVMHQQAAQVDRSAAQARAARGSRWPTLSMSFGFNQRTFAQERDALFDMYPDQARFGSTSLQMSIPVFSRFQTSARIAEAQVGMDNARETLRRTRLQVEEAVRSRFISLQTAYQGYQIALRSQEIAEERLQLARDQFRLGSRTFTELQRDIDDAANAEREVINQLFGFAEARANLEETVGDLGVESGMEG